MKSQPSPLFGETLKTYVGEGLKLTETLCGPGFRAPRHSHELFQFCWIIDGGFSEECGPKTRECLPRTLITHPSDETHANKYYSSGAHCFVMEIEQRWLTRSREYSVMLDRSTECRYGLPVWLAKRLYDEFHRMDAVSPLIFEGLMLEMMAEVSRVEVKTSDRSPRWLAQTRDLLQGNFSDDMSLESIAKAVGIHPVHLARVFRHHYGCTVGEYVRRLRVEFACRELCLTDAPLPQIALASGFCDQSHFSRTFKKVVGLTPSMYRSRFRSR